MPKENYKSDVKWSVIFEDYVAQNLVVGREKPFSLKELAASWNIGYGTLRNYASKNGWAKELKRHIAEAKNKSIETIKDQSVLNELDIRVRQATVSKFLIELGVDKLRNLGKEKLTINQAIKLIRLGLTEERKAAGIPDKYLHLRESEGSNLSEYGHILNKEFSENVSNAVVDVLSELLNHVETGDDLNIDIIEGEISEITNEAGTVDS